MVGNLNKEQKADRRVGLLLDFALWWAMFTIFGLAPLAVLLLLAFLPGLGMAFRLIGSGLVLVFWARPGIQQLFRTVPNFPVWLREQRDMVWEWLERKAGRSTP